jgi:excisionase family DNA binding protein
MEVVKNKKLKKLLVDRIIFKCYIICRSFKGVCMEILYKVNEVAKILKVHPITVRNLIKRGILSHVKVGGSIRIRESDLKELLKSSQKSDKPLEDYSF